jgi:chromosome partitioning protein
MSTARPSANSTQKIVVFGNEKGGSGKSTAAAQVAIGLLRQGHSVAVLDLDMRQATLSRHMANRAERGDLPMPAQATISTSSIDSRAEAAEAERQSFEAAIAELAGNEFIIVDTPGSDSRLSRMAHARADSLVTPINDSFVDFDLLARVEPTSHKILGPSVYAELVWDRRKDRALAGGGPIDWIVMRNRLGYGDTRNKREVGMAIEELGKRIGFRIAPGFSERAIFRELFLSGLTLFDLGGAVHGPPLAVSHIAGRQEARLLIDMIVDGPPRKGAQGRAP